MLLCTIMRETPMKKRICRMKLLPYIKKAVQLKPDYQQAHNNLGKVYFTLGQYDDALTEYHNALKIDPDFPYAYNNLGVLYNKLGRQEDAVAAYKKPCRSIPSTPMHITTWVTFTRQECSTTSPWRHTSPLLHLIRHRYMSITIWALFMIKRPFGRRHFGIYLCNKTRPKVPVFL